ncbi:MAG: 50S ribosomal protein L17 [Chloroflexi bacterium]|nr:50S ribosomal protein L17 [Chloroflexota bacterium]MBI4201408.1 50S ribosomal protein L17 [Chloroflexota bacterium]
MRHKVAGRKFSRATGPRQMLYRTMVTDLLKNEKMVTTQAKAKEIRGFAEKMITLGKQNSLPARREAGRFITEAAVVRKLFTELGPRYAQRPGGYTRMVLVGVRSGDAAPLAQIELLKE